VSGVRKFDKEGRKKIEKMASQLSTSKRERLDVFSGGGGGIRVLWPTSNHEGGPKNGPQYH